MTMAEEQGALLGLQGIAIPQACATAKDLKPLVESMLQQGLDLLSSMPSEASPQTEQGARGPQWRSKGSKRFAHSAAAVELFEARVAKADRQETWAARRSVHNEAAAAGTASWEEWLWCFKESHAEAEKDFTPSIVSTRSSQQWDCSGIEVELGSDSWAEWTLRVDESVHQLPGPLRQRVFGVLQATTALRGRRDFVVVQIAVKDDSASQHSRLVRGAYTSVERVRDLGAGRIEWTMATVSDAKGVLPAWMQRMAVPRQIAKDVDLFLAWRARERQSPP
ncbi:hypothetical protein CDD81_2176 [Ophiocordyceps australis]|uniref:DUF3074 domain-containing protein n=1 Tax=Ophiocordyceps australis TaxID=1399860 RepID=A0A2C5XUB9_9HYPO|nr:hypothetical protein CDD81_2176 [Ophiocordyceps australis]